MIVETWTANVKPTNAAELALLNIFKEQPPEGNLFPGRNLTIDSTTLLNVKKIDAAYFSDDFDIKVVYQYYKPETE